MLYNTEIEEYRENHETNEPSMYRESPGCDSRESEEHILVEELWRS
jgi:hypothetical protein